MDRLAPEIISNILSHIVPPEYRSGRYSHFYGSRPFASLSVICSHWQPIVEAITFRKLHLSAADLSHAVDRNILTPRRLSYVRRLEWCLSSLGMGSFPKLFEQLNNNPDFESAMGHLFHLLAQTPLDHEPTLDLALIYSKFDACDLEDEEEEVWVNEDGGLSKEGNRDSCSVAGNKFTPPNLPELPMVRSFELSNDSSSESLSPRVIYYMATRMPRLQKMTAVLTMMRRTTVSSIHQRIELAESLSGLPMSIQYFSMSYHQSRELPDGLLFVENGEDILTRELRRFTQRKGLKDFTFYGCIEPSIFWPLDSDTSEPREWPTLKAFVLHLSHMPNLANLRCGKPLDEVRPPLERVVGIRVEYESRPSSNWKRVYAHKGVMHEFFQAAAKCSARMPRAEHVSLDFNDKWFTSLAYCTMIPGEPCLKINGKPDLEVDAEIVDEWQRTSRVHNLVFEMSIGEDERVNNSRSRHDLWKGH